MSGVGATEDPSMLWADGQLGKGRGPSDAEVAFAQVREDPRGEVSLVEPGMRVFAIASGGCTVLAMLEKAPARVVALDVNPAQLELLRLKLLVLKARTGRELRKAFERDGRAAYGAARAALPPATRAYWDARPSALSRGLDGCGTLERRLRRLLPAFHLTVHSREDTWAFLEGSQATDAARAKTWDSWRWRLALRTVLTAGGLSRFYGPAFLRGLPSDFAEQFRRRFSAATAACALRENGYLWQTFLQRYPEGEAGLPRHLQAEGQAAILASLDALTLVTAEAGSWLSAQPARTFDLFALSNILELAGPRQVDELAAAVTHAAAPGARVCLRAIFGASSPSLTRARAAFARQGAFVEESLPDIPERAPFAPLQSVLRFAG